MCPGLFGQRIRAARTASRVFPRSHRRCVAGGWPGARYARARCRVRRRRCVHASGDHGRRRRLGARHRPLSGVARRCASASRRSRTPFVRFQATELDAFSPEQKFDAVIGRFVLIYQPDPAATLQRLCCHLRRGGIIAFQEMAMPLARSVPEGPQIDRCIDWILTGFARASWSLTWAENCSRPSSPQVCRCRK